MQAIGNLTTTSCGQETIAQVVSVDYVMDKLRKLTSTPQDKNFSKVNSVGQALLAVF
ncbi:GD20165 [Drosophila simulans]|nr:GD20165 [Drosophila simulans]